MINFGEERIYNAKIKYSYLGFDSEKLLYIKIGVNTEDGEFIFEDTKMLDIQNILETLELQSWEEVARKFCRVKVIGGKVVAIGNLIENKWVKNNAK